MLLFKAIVIICSVSGQPGTPPKCAVFVDDLYGPFNTKQSCEIMTKQMVSELTSGKYEEDYLAYFGDVVNFETKRRCLVFDDGKIMS